MYTHQVDEHEVEEALSHPYEDRPGREDSRIAMGQNTSWAIFAGHVCSSPRTGQRLCHHRVSINREAFTRVSTKEAEERNMKTAQFPEGWDKERVGRVLAHYEKQTEEEAVAEDEAMREEKTQTLMEIPNELVPTVRELIAKHSG